jgi:hypothetical protein
MTDQQRAGSVGAFGSAVARTPTIDALAARGTRFNHAYSQHSACSQSRIAIRRCRLVADEDDAAVEAGGACGLGRLGAGEAGADDRERRAGHARSREGLRSNAVARRARVSAASRSPKSRRAMS